MAQHFLLSANARTLSIVKIANDILTRCLGRSVSNEFCGYWQGNKRVAERLFHIQ